MLNLSLRRDKKISIAGGIVHTTITRKIRSTESKCTLKNSKLLKVFLVLQYHRDEAFYFPGKFHFLVKTITDSHRLGLVYLNLLFSTANGVIFCEIYLQSAAHITSDPRFIYLFIYFIFKFFLTDARSLISRSAILDPDFPVNLEVLLIKIIPFFFDH